MRRSARRVGYRLVLWASAYRWLNRDTEVEFPASTRVERLNTTARLLGLPDLGVAWLSRGLVMRLGRDGSMERVGHQIGYRGPPGDPVMPIEVAEIFARRLARAAGKREPATERRPSRPREAARQGDGARSRRHAPLLAYTCDDGSSRGSGR